jgi:glycosyltransferase involved in cell wall biosynthesis
MRIGINFHTADTYISGVEYHALGLLRGLLRVDKRNHYVVYTNQPSLVKTHVPPAGNLGIVGIRHLKTRIARIAWEHASLPRAAVRDELDVLHCTSYICPLLGRSVPYVVTIHDTIAIDHPGWCKRTNSLYFNLFMEAAARKASCIISVSRSTARDVLRNFELPPSKVRVIHPGIERIFAMNGESCRYAQVRERYRLPKRYVLYVGNIEPKKNVRTLLHVQTLLQERGLPHKLVLAGKRSWRSGSEFKEVSRQVACGSVVVTGYVDRADLPFVYRMADVFVFPSLHEGFGFPPLEAMACGVPVISSTRGALAETVGDAAWTIDPQSPEQIADAIATITTDSAARQRHVRKGLELCGRFSWERAAQETLSVYEAVAASDRVV